MGRRKKEQNTKGNQIAVSKCGEFLPGGTYRQPREETGGKLGGDLVLEFKRGIKAEVGEVLSLISIQLSFRLSLLSHILPILLLSALGITKYPTAELTLLCRGKCCGFAGHTLECLEKAERWGLNVAYSLLEDAIPQRSPKLRAAPKCPHVEDLHALLVAFLTHST